MHALVHLQSNAVLLNVCVAPCLLVHLGMVEWSRNRRRFLVVSMCRHGRAVQELAVVLKLGCCQLVTSRHGRAVKELGVVLGQISQSNINMERFCFALLACT